MSEISEKIFTGVKDVDREILLRIESEREMLNACLLNKYSASLCNDTFFMNRILKKFPGAFNFKIQNNKNISWKKYYIYLLTYIEKLEKEFQFYYQGGDPKLYYDILNKKMNIEHAIETATINNLPDLVDYYMRESDPNEIDFNASLVAAVSVNNKKLINLFLSYGANFYDGALLEAAKNKNEDLVEFFLEKGADINDGLCGAVISEDMNWIQYFMDKGAKNWPYAVTCSPSLKLADYFINLSEKNALPVNYLKAMNNAARIGNLKLINYYYEKNGGINKNFLNDIVHNAILGDSENVIQILEYLKAKGFKEWLLALYTANNRKNPLVIEYVKKNIRK